MLGAGIAVLSASVAIRMRASRSGKLRICLSRMISSICFEPGLVMGQDRVADELLFLECLDDVAIVGGWQALLAGDLRGDRPASGSGSR